MSDQEKTVLAPAQQSRLRVMIEALEMVENNTQGIYSYSARLINGQEQSLADYAGKVLLIVNVASHCGFTGQYSGLEQLYQEFRSKGLVVLGFPCSQFMNQEFSENTKIQEFCSRTYNVTFPIFEKIDVNGPAAHPLYTYLKSQAPGLFGVKRIAWNFTKFLVDRDGQVIARYAPTRKPESLRKTILDTCSVSSATI